MVETFSRLFSPGRIAGLELANRIVLPALSTNSAERGGFVSPNTLEFYRVRSRGGAALSVVEASIVQPTVNATGPAANDAGLSNANHQVPLPSAAACRTPGWVSRPVGSGIGKAATAHSHTTTEISNLDAGADFNAGVLAGAGGGVGVALPTCSGTDKLTANGTQVSCAADQTGGGGGGTQQRIRDTFHRPFDATTRIV